MDQLSEETEKLQNYSIAAKILYAENKNNFMMSGLKVKYFLAWKSGLLNNFYKSTGVKRMLEDKDFSDVT